MRVRGSGEWWDWERMREVCERHGVELVRRESELEELSLGEIEAVVTGR